MGVKIIANDINKALIGSQISFNLEKPELHENQILDKKQTIDEKDILNKQHIKLDSSGVTVFASSQGSLDALVNFLQKNIPIVEVNIGSIMKKHINKMIINKNNKKEFSTILAFNVKMDEEVEELAKKNEIKIFSAEIIYHLHDLYTKHKDDIVKERKSLFRPQAIFPCSIKILEKHIYNKKSPLIFGVNIVEGELHIGTPIIISETKLIIGNVTNIQLNGKEVNTGKKGTEVCIKVENIDNIQYEYDQKTVQKVSNPVRN
jgi:translation initiation factor 5B